MEASQVLESALDLLADEGFVNGSGFIYGTDPEQLVLLYKENITIKRRLSFFTITESDPDLDPETYTKYIVKLILLEFEEKKKQNNLEPC